MYADYFGLDTLPFSPTTALENTYRSKELKEALTHISYTVENREPLLLLTGEVGCGKSTSVQVAVRKYSRSMSIATLSHTTLTPRELLEALAINYKMQPDKRESKPKLLQRLEKHFSRCMDLGRPALVFIDEAHLLKQPVLEELRLFSNLTVNGKNLVQIVLVGQPELEKHVQRNRSLCQRIGVRYRLGPLSREETVQYISHRLNAAGNERTSEIFSEEAIDVVYRLSGGFPRQINVIAGYSMLNCYAHDRTRVDAGDVESVKAEYGFEDVTSVVEPVSDSCKVANHEEPTTVLDEKTLPEKPDEDENDIDAKQEQPEYQIDPSGYPTPLINLDSSKARWSAIGLLVVTSIFVVWIFMPSRSPSALDDAAVPKSVLPDVPSVSPNENSLPSTRLNHNNENSSGSLATEPVAVKEDSEEPAADVRRESRQAAGQKPPRREGIGLTIKLDRVLVDNPGQPVTVQIASILDSRLADDSLSRASAKTGIPGAVETVPSGDATWYLVLLGCFDTAHDAEVAVDSTTEVLREMGVTDVRIKPAPRWLRDLLAGIHHKQSFQDEL